MKERPIDEVLNKTILQAQEELAKWHDKQYEALQKGDRQGAFTAYQMAGLQTAHLQATIAQLVVEVLDGSESNRALAREYFLEMWGNFESICADPSKNRMM